MWSESCAAPDITYTPSLQTRCHDTVLETEPTGSAKNAPQNCINVYSSKTTLDTPIQFRPFLNHHDLAVFNHACVSDSSIILYHRNFSPYVQSNQMTVANPQVQGSANQNGNGTAASGGKPSIDVEIATRANDPKAVPNILKQIVNSGETPSVDNDRVRLALLANARALVRALETPRETMIKHCWAQVHSTSPIQAENNC
jgi:hypothetical protein